MRYRDKFCALSVAGPFRRLCMQTLTYGPYMLNCQPIAGCYTAEIYYFAVGVGMKRMGDRKDGREMKPFY